jgi:hypothetical protein
MWWEEERPTTPTHGQNVDIARLASRVKQGKMVLFLGSDMVSAYCDEPHEERALIEQLAKQIGYTHFDGTLSSIAECYQLRPHLGLTALLDNEGWEGISHALYCAHTRLEKTSWEL